LVNGTIGVDRLSVQTLQAIEETIPDRIASFEGHMPLGPSPAASSQPLLLPDHEKGRRPGHVDCTVRMPCELRR